MATAIIKSLLWYSNCDHSYRNLWDNIIVNIIDNIIVNIIVIQ